MCYNQDGDTMKKLEMVLVIVALILIIIGVIGYIIIGQTRSYIIDNIKFKDYEILDNKTIINRKVSGCYPNKPIFTIRANDDVKTEFQVCRYRQSAGPFDSDEIINDNYDYKHLKKAFTEYKKSHKTTLKSMEKNVFGRKKEILHNHLYILYNDNNEKELYEFAEYLFNKNKDLEDSYKYKLEYAKENTSNCFGDNIKNMEELEKRMELIKSYTPCVSNQ